MKAKEPTLLSYPETKLQLNTAPLIYNIRESVEIGDVSNERDWKLYSILIRDGNLFNG